MNAVNTAAFERTSYGIGREAATAALLELEIRLQRGESLADAVAYARETALERLYHDSTAAGVAPYASAKRFAGYLGDALAPLLSIRDDVRAREWSAVVTLATEKVSLSCGGYYLDIEDVLKLHGMGVLVKEA